MAAVKVGDRVRYNGTGRIRVGETALVADFVDAAGVAILKWDQSEWDGLNHWFSYNFGPDDSFSFTILPEPDEWEGELELL